jgi:hypothetical protein
VNIGWKELSSLIRICTIDDVEEKATLQVSDRATQIKHVVEDSIAELFCEA